MKKRNWKKRPKGCKKTISGMHIPSDKVMNYAIETYCSACGLIDDTGEFEKWLFGSPKKIDDTKNNHSRKEE